MTEDDYNDEHWRELIETIIERIGMERFLDLLGRVLNADLQAIVALHRQLRQQELRPDA